MSRQARRYAKGRPAHLSKPDHRIMREITVTFNSRQDVLRFVQHKGLTYRFIRARLVPHTQTVHAIYRINQRKDNR